MFYRRSKIAVNNNLHLSQPALLFLLWSQSAGRKLALRLKQGWEFFPSLPRHPWHRLRVSKHFSPQDVDAPLSNLSPDKISTFVKKSGQCFGPLVTLWASNQPYISDPLPQVQPSACKTIVLYPRTKATSGGMWSRRWMGTKTISGPCFFQWNYEMSWLPRVAITLRSSEILLNTRLCRNKNLRDRLGGFHF